MSLPLPGVDGAAVADDEPARPVVERLRVVVEADRGDVDRLVVAEPVEADLLRVAAGLAAVERVRLAAGLVAAVPVPAAFAAPERVPAARAGVAFAVDAELARVERLAAGFAAVLARAVVARAGAAVAAADFSPRSSAATRWARPSTC